MRALLLSAALASVAWFQFGQDRSGRELARVAVDLFDPRPAHSLLFIGNSRTYYNDMPSMVRAIADSAHDPEKYQVVVAAYPGASFQSLSEETTVHRLAAKQWNDVVLQGESRGQTTRAQMPDFERSGEALANLMHPDRGQPWLIVNWPYDPAVYADRITDRSVHAARIKESHDEIASRANLRRIDVLSTWERMRAEFPQVQLTVDGNHPSLAGSYLVALSVYSGVSGRPVTELGYAPAGLDDRQAAEIRHVVGEMSPTE